MNEKEISEIRRRFRQDKSNITHIRGCYVNEKKEIVTEFDEPLSMMDEEECEKFLTILKRTLSGNLGKNLTDISFTTSQVVDSEEHRLLMSLRESDLKNDDVVRDFFLRVAESVSMDGHYLILLAHDTYDVYYRSRDGQRQDDASSEVYSYIVCSICPIKMTKPALSYYIPENRFRNLQIDRIVAPPEIGFIFPAFDDRCANIYNALYYSKSPAGNHPEFAEAIFKTGLPMPADEQKETFESILEDTLSDDCNLEVVQAVQNQLCEKIKEHKAAKEEEPLTVSKSEVREILESCGVAQEHIDSFSEKYDAEFGAECQLTPRNLVNTRQFQVSTPSVVIRTSPDKSDLIETRVIDGVKYLLVRVEEGVEVNGVSIQIS